MSGSLRRLAGLVSSSAGKIKRAKALLEEGKPAEAFKLLAPVARAGHAEAEFMVARCYLEGRGVPPSAAEANTSNLLIISLFIVKFKYIINII